MANIRNISGILTKCQNWIENSSTGFFFLSVTLRLSLCFGKKKIYTKLIASFHVCAEFQ